MKVFVAADGSESAERALAWVAAHGPGLGASVVVAHVLPDPVYAVAPETAAMLGPVPAEVRDRTLELAEHEWAAPLRAAGLEYEIRMLDGPLASTLLHAAEECGADLVVVGRRGLGGFKTMLLGSVSNQVVHHATLPVVVVP